MLTYSLSFNKVISIPPLKKIVSAKIIECLWDATSLLYEEPIEIEDWDEVLTKHRDQTISASNTFTEENDLPSIFKTVFKESVFSWSRANSEVLQWKRNYDPDDEMGDLKANLNDARNYFTVNGEFDDLAWTKRVVLDPVYPKNYRFYTACKYCLDDESAVLWSELKNDDLVPCNGILGDILEEMDPMVALRIFQLEGLDFLLVALLPREEPFSGNIYELGLKKAALWGYEHATRYFWKNIAEPEKITEEEKFFELIEKSELFDEKVAVFLYSQLSKQRKQDFLDRFIETGEQPTVWVTLLLSPFTEEERSETIELVIKLPFDQYSYVLAEIAAGIKENSYPIHREEVFMLLWIHLSPENRGKFLEEQPSIIKRLIEANSFYIADYVIKVSLLK